MNPRLRYPLLNPYGLPDQGGAGAAGAISAGTTNASVGGVSFADSNGVSFGVNGQTVTASVAGTSQQSINFSGGTTSNNLSAITFSNSNGVSFGLNAGTMTGSVATSLTNVNLSAGTTSNNLSAFVFSNSNNVSFGLNGSTVTASATIATSLSNINVSAGTTSANLSNVVFSNSNGVSFGLNGSTITASAAGGAGGTASYFGLDPADGVYTQGFGNMAMHVQPVFIPFNLSASVLNLIGSVSISSSSNSSHGGTLSFSAGIYTLTGATFSLASSGSQSFAWTNTSNDSIGSLTGQRLFPIPITINATPGAYYIGIWSRTSTANTNWFTISYSATAAANTIVGGLGAFLNASNATAQNVLGYFILSTFSTAMPASIGSALWTALNPPSNAIARVFPWFNMHNQSQI